MTLLQVEHVTKRFGVSTVVDDVSLEVRDGEAVGLIGANGAGKTTLFRMIAGELALTAGRVLFAGGPVAPSCRRTRAARARAHVPARAALRRPHGPRAPPRHPPGARGASRPRSRPLLARVVDGRRARAVRRRRCGSATSRSSRTRRRRRSASGSAGPSSSRAPWSRSRRCCLPTSRRRASTPPRARGSPRPSRASALRPGSRSCSSSTTSSPSSAVAERVVAMDAGQVIAEGPFDEVVRDPRVVESWLGTTT